MSKAVDFRTLLECHLVKYLSTTLQHISPSVRTILFEDLSRVKGKLLWKLVNFYIFVYIYNNWHPAVAWSSCISGSDRSMIALGHPRGTISLWTIDHDFFCSVEKEWDTDYCIFILLLNRVNSCIHFVQYLSSDGNVNEIGSIFHRSSSNPSNILSLSFAPILQDDHAQTHSKSRWAYLLSYMWFVCFLCN